MTQNLSCCRMEVDDNLIATATELLKQEKSILENKANIFSLIGNEARLKIIRLFLSYEKMCVCDLADILQMKQSPISQHLRKLKDGGLLQSKRDGMTIFYSVVELKAEFLRKIIQG